MGRAGTGLHQEQWLCDALPIGSEALIHLSEQITEWCMRTMASLRRPYDIDQVALSVACAHPGNAPLSTVTFGVFRPAEFYADEGPRQQLESFVQGLDVGTLNERPEPVRSAAALFSWSDISRVTVFADEG